MSFLNSFGGFIKGLTKATDIKKTILASGSGGAIGSTTT